MGDDDRTVQRLDLEIDEPSLSHLGWRADEIEAHLVTTTYGEWEHHQEIELCGTVRFLGRTGRTASAAVPTRPPSCSPSVARARPSRPSTSGW